MLTDGDPLRPDPAWQWRTAAAAGTATIGISPGYVQACRREGIHPREMADRRALRGVVVVGSALNDNGYRWLLDDLDPTVYPNVGSGGADVLFGVLQGVPTAPVRLGEIPADGLRVATDAWSEAGEPAPVGELGELVITAPMPSMPIGLSGDDDDAH